MQACSDSIEVRTEDVNDNDSDSHVFLLVATLPGAKRCRPARLDSACLVEEASAPLLRKGAHAESHWLQRMPTA